MQSLPSRRGTYSSAFAAINVVRIASVAYNNRLLLTEARTLISLTNIKFFKYCIVLSFEKKMSIHLHFKKRKNIEDVSSICYFRTCTI